MACSRSDWTTSASHYPRRWRIGGSSPPAIWLPCAHCPTSPPASDLFRHVSKDTKTEPTSRSSLYSLRATAGRAADRDAGGHPPPAHCKRFAARGQVAARCGPRGLRRCATSCGLRYTSKDLDADRPALGTATRRVFLKYDCYFNDIGVLLSVAPAKQASSERRDHVRAHAEP